MKERVTITPIAPDYLEEMKRRMQKMSNEAQSPERRNGRPNRRSSTQPKIESRHAKKGFRKQVIPPSTPRGLFTVFMSDDRGDHIGQIWAAGPGSAASVMAPWSEGRLRRAKKAREVPVELVGWDDTPTPAELSTKSGVPEPDLDPGLTYGTELCNVWCAEHRSGRREHTLYVVETIPLGCGLRGDE